LRGRAWEAPLPSTSEEITSRCTVLMQHLCIARA